MSYKICKENCEPRTLITETPIKEINKWHRLIDIGGYTSFRDEATMWITAKEQIQCVYDILYDAIFKVFYIEKVYDPKEVATHIEEFYSHLPDERTIKFIVSELILDTEQVYLIDQDEEDFRVYDSMTQLINEGVYYPDDEFIYVADLVGDMFMITDRCEDLEDKMSELQKTVANEAASMFYDQLIELSNSTECEETVKDDNHNSLWKRIKDNMKWRSPF